MNGRDIKNVIYNTSFFSVSCNGCADLLSASKEAAVGMACLLYTSKDHADDYEAFIFMTYLYYTTVKGLPLVKDKAILISTAHDEPPIYLKTFDTLFQMPKALFYLTVEEKKFVERKFRNERIINNDGYGGSGV